MIEAGTYEGNDRFIQTRERCKNNDPPIEPGQIWIAHLDKKDEPFRRIRIIARHIDDIDGRPAWIYQDKPAKMRRTDYYRLGTCPEFNLRYVFTLEANTD